MLEGKRCYLTTRRELVQPLLGRRARYRTHNAIGKALRLLEAGGLHQAHGGINRSVSLNAGEKHLIGTQTQCVEHLWCDGIEPTGRALFDDGIEHALTA